MLVVSPKIACLVASNEPVCSVQIDNARRDAAVYVMSKREKPILTDKEGGVGQFLLVFGDDHIH